MIQEVLNDFIGYLKKPDPFIKQRFKFIPYKDLFLLVVLSLVASQILESLVYLLANFKIIPPEPKSVFDSEKYSNWEIALVGILVAPPLEELIFRYQLRSINFLCAFIGIIAFSFIANSYNNLIIALFGLTTLICIIFIIRYLNNHTKIKYQIIKFAFPFSFYLIAIVFGLVHITNFLDYKDYGPLIFLWVLPQLFGGLILGFTRMRYGFYSGILLHAVYNLIGIGLSLLITSKI
ncbi:hypothetical protein A5893_10305 [Pedobacter psychrophilus]|uniref:CAAX prenyl protease 2/Lysostaphin resistance protein A-like domain-containing protein n=1 Tax=Pedobacter psychrophilus TaxID=1826909 RepID=A0A179DDF1_9SPHI|nr:CPBP family glutamic-type intramembrane protease [Pedobacter psychrophilus]OAQ39061.1 hypothetical protein A5893_10305 [Pedobacter psychrophilus]